MHEHTFKYHSALSKIVSTLIVLTFTSFEDKHGYTTLINFLQLYHDKERRLLCLKTINNVINSDMIKKQLTEESKDFNKHFRTN